MERPWVTKMVFSMEETITRCKEQASQAMEMFLRNLSHVPEEMLSWSPSPTSRSSLQIAAHVAGYSLGFARLLRAGQFPESAEEFLRPIQADVESVTSREGAEEMLRRGIEDTLQALDTVRPEQVASILETPIGPTPFLFFMTIPANHLWLHTGQIDYLQTCWGDQQVYF